MILFVDKDTTLFRSSSIRYRGWLYDYLEFHDDLDDFEEAYCGEWDSEEDFARHIVEECYNLEKTMGDLARFFDYEAFGRELFMFDYTMGANGHVFRPV